MNIPVNYATLYQVKEYRHLLDTTSDDALLQRFLNWSTGYINQYKGRRFDVRLATILHDAPLPESSSFGSFDGSRRVVSQRERSMILSEDLLEMVELTNGDGTELTTDDYTLAPAGTPKSVVRLVPGCSWMPNDSGDKRQAISVTGWWGHHDSYPDCFVSSLDTVLDAPLSSNATQIHVANVNGLTADLDTPRFQSGQLLRSGTELIYLLTAEAVDAGNDLLTVVRGVNGTTAVSHIAGTSIEIFRPMSAINQAAIRLVAWRYAQKDVDAFDRTYNVGTGVSTSPAAIPRDITELLGARKVRP